MVLDTLLAVILLIGAVGYIALGIQLIAGRRGVGTLPSGVLFLFVALWVMGGAIELLASSFFMFSVGRTFHYVGTSIVPIVAYVYFREYTGQSTSIHRLVLLLIIPFVSITLAATNAFHEMVWALPATNAQGDFLTRPVAWGPYFLFVHAPYTYALGVAAALSLIMHTSAVARAHRKGLFLLLAASLGPASAALAYDFGFGPNTVSFIPFVFTLMLPFYAWMLLAERLVQVSPLAYETVFQNMQDPVVVVDEQGRIIGLNTRAEQLLSVNETSAMLAPLDSVICDGSTEVFEAIKSGKPRKMMTSTGRFLHVQVSSMASHDETTDRGKVLMFRDVSDVEKAQAEVRANEKLLRTLIDHSVNGIIRLRWDEHEDGTRDLRCIFANAAAARFLDTETETLENAVGEDIVKLATNAMDPVDSASLTNEFRRAAQDNASMDTEVQHDSGGEGKWLRMIVEPFGSDIAVTLVDITDGKVKEKQMEAAAASDPLTGVHNRRGFERKASKRLSESPDDATGALLFIDLNEFKAVNDSEGHEIGDQILIVAAKRLQRSLRSCDIIGRPGGDEFVALVPDVTPEVAETLARRLAAALEEPYNVAGKTLACAASIGLALYPENANTLTGLLREADQAMYRAKARCRGAVNIRSEDLLEKAM